MNATQLFRRPILAITAFACVALSGTVLAEEMKVMLSGDMEVPPVATTASGNGSIAVNPDMSVSGSIATAGLMATAAHIHVGKTGANGPVAVGLTKDGDNGWKVPDGAKLDATQFQAYKDGALYVNVHSAAHKGGEIRGQLMPAMGGK